jgi:hypothetical protein
MTAELLLFALALKADNVRRLKTNQQKGIVNFWCGT